MEFLIIGLIIAVFSQMGAKDEAVADAKTQRDKREATLKRQLDARRATAKHNREQAEIDKKVAAGIEKGLAAAPPIGTTREPTASPPPEPDA